MWTSRPHKSITQHTSNNLQQQQSEESKTERIEMRWISWNRLVVEMLRNEVHNRRIWREDKRWRFLGSVLWFVCGGEVRWRDLWGRWFRRRCIRWLLQPGLGHSQSSWWELWRVSSRSEGTRTGVSANYRENLVIAHVGGSFVRRVRSSSLTLESSSRKFGLTLQH